MKKFNEEHEWVEVNDGIASIGISAYAVEQLGDITFLELPELETQAEMAGSIAFIESVKAASDIYAPLSGEVVEVNEELLDTPELLNADAEGNFIFKIKLSNEDELNSLMSGDEYAVYINTL